MKHLFDDHTHKFDAISLQDLNLQAALLDRQESKYVLTPERFFEIVPDLTRSFRILEIGELRIFNYKSFYFDSDNLIGYTYHNQERIKRRFKIRSRHYVDSDLCFFEIKLKSKRGGTIKRRIDCPLNDYGIITDRARHFIETTYQQVYGLRFEHELKPKLEVNYDRITLVAKDSSERMTIDFNLHFSRQGKTSSIKFFVIVETKSARLGGIADSIFKQQSIRSGNFSKYCLGVNLFFNKVKYNRFKPLLKMYENLPVYQAVNEVEISITNASDPIKVRITRKQNEGVNKRPRREVDKTNRTLGLQLESEKLRAHRMRRRVALL